ncbi:MAG TPA: aconitate hydratase [Nitrospinae bacterium]|nr:aconitate hydratase [Nitrospinota bacterium]
MAKSLAQLLIDEHLVSGDGGRVGAEIEIRADQVLLQDASGPMALLQFEAMGMTRVAQKTAVMYADHQTLQMDYLHTEGHRFLLGFCQKYGIHFSKPGNGICHNVHLETYAVPGESLAGTDSHTPQAGAAGMLAIGAGGIDVAVAMGGGTLILPRPEIIEVHLSGKLGPWRSAKDVILELLRRLTGQGGVGKLFEYTGPGVETLSVPERSTIANMGTELGLTSSLFPSDERTWEFFGRMNRPGDWRALSADRDAAYDGRIELDLSRIEPLIALPSNPDKVVPVSEVAGTPIEQVIAGSCTNGSYTDIASFAQIMRGRKVAPGVDAIVFPGSRQAFEELAREGHIADLLAAGVLVSEATCGSCPGYGHIPAPGTKSLRTFSRNFKGRSGLTEDAVYICGTETAALSAIHGVITAPPGDLKPPEVLLPHRFAADGAGIVPPSAEPDRIELLQSPNIVPIPAGEPFGDAYEGEILIKLGDSVSTDTIIPAGVEAITYRTNAPALSEFLFRRIDPEFAGRARAAGGGIILGGDLYGQGSAREQAALCPMCLGVRAVVAKSFARIHRANLINWGILPLELADPGEWDRLEQGHRLRLSGIPEGLSQNRLAVENRTIGSRFEVTCALTARERSILLAGGVLAHTKARA